MKDDYNPFDHLAWLETNLVKQSHVIEELATLMAKVAENHEQQQAEIEALACVITNLTTRIQELENEDGTITGNTTKKIH